MNSRDFWYDVLRSGAILGIVMALSSIFERYVLVFSDLSLGAAALAYFGEWLVTYILFVWLLVRFTRCRREATDPQFGFSYSSALSYILLISMLAGVIVGVADTLFISAMGFDSFVAGNAERLTEVRTMYQNMGIGGSELKIFDDMIHAIRTSVQPSMLQSVFSSFSHYIMVGGIPGLIIAGFMRRDPQIPVSEN